MAHFLDKDGLQRFFNGLKNVFALKDHSHTTVNGHTVESDVPSGAKFTDTTYESKAAASGGTAVSLVTTGEKYTWNSKTNTRVKGNAESSYRTGDVNLTAANIGAAAASHTHNYAGSQSAGGAADKALSIPIADMDTTSTATEFTAQVAGVTALNDGVCFYLRNDVITSASGCTLNVNSLGAKPIYNAATSAVLTTAFAVNKIYLCWYDSTLVSGGCWVVLTDNNTTYTGMHQLYHSTAGGYLADSVVYRYQLLFQMDEDTVTPLNNVSNSTGTSKAMLTNVEFDPFGEIFYYGAATTVNADARVSGGSTFYTANLNLRYTFNCGTTLTAYAPFYLKVVMQSNGKVKLATGTCWTQSLPTTNDGYYYIFLGRTYSTYQGHLYPWHPVYYHDGTQIREYINPEKAINASQVASGTLSRDRLPGGLWIDMGTISSLPTTKTFTGVRTDMICAQMELGTPSAQRSDWTINTDTANSITISGTISGSTTCKLLLVQAESGTAS